MICPESLNILVCIIYFVTVSHFHNSLCKKLLAGGQYFLKVESTCLAFAKQFLSLNHRRSCYSYNVKNESTSAVLYNPNDTCPHAAAFGIILSLHMVWRYIRVIVFNHHNEIHLFCILWVTRWGHKEQRNVTSAFMGTWDRNAALRTVISARDGFSHRIEVASGPFTVQENNQFHYHICELPTCSATNYHELVGLGQHRCIAL